MGAIILKILGTLILAIVIGLFMGAWIHLKDNGSCSASQNFGYSLLLWVGLDVVVWIIIGAVKLIIG
jgi:high-affinity Fe2+/Pb2+ permease